MRVLIVSFFFPPFNAIASKRWDAMSKTLSESVDLKIFCPQSEGNLHQLTSEVNCIRASHSSTCSHKVTSNVNRKVNSLRKVFGRLISYMRTLDSTFFSWYLRNRKQFRQVIVGYQPNIVLVSVGPFSSAFFAFDAKRILGNNVKLVLDIRDAQSLNDKFKKNYIKQKIDEIIDKKVVNVFDRILTVSPTLVELLSAFYSKKIDLVYNGFEENVSSKPSRQLEKVVFHGGQLYDHRIKSIDLFLSAIKYFPEWKIIFRHWGSAELLRKVDNLVDKYRLQNVHLLGKVDAKTVDDELESVGVSLILEDLNQQSILSKGTLTGKVFELIAKRCAVLAICRSDSDINKILSDVNKGHACDNTRQIIDFLKDVEKYQGTSSSILEYSRAKQADYVLRIFNDLIRS